MNIALQLDTKVAVITLTADEVQRLPELEGEICRLAIKEYRAARICGARLNSVVVRGPGYESVVVES